MALLHLVVTTVPCSHVPQTAFSNITVTMTNTVTGSTVTVTFWRQPLGSMAVAKMAFVFDPPYPP